MRSANLSSQNERNADTGLVWDLVLNNQSTAVNVPKYSTLRITAAANCIVTLDGSQSVFILANDTAIINAGVGIDDSSNANTKVKVQFSANVYCSVARQ